MKNEPKKEFVRAVMYAGGGGGGGDDEPYLERRVRLDLQITGKSSITLRPQSCAKIIAHAQDSNAYNFC